MKKVLFPIFLFAFFSSTVKAQVAGCPDPAADNYDPSATVNNGSCTYNSATITPKLKYNLNTVLNESSGLSW
jgi:hypothetical protein